MSINEEKLKMWCDQVDRRLDRLEGNYNLKEPLLKDYPNEMKAIKAYGYSPLIFFRQTEKGYSTFNFDIHFICFNGLFKNLIDGETYTIDELCGEDEEWV